MSQTIEKDRPASATARLWASSLCITVLAVMAASGALLDWLANSESMGIWMDRKWAQINDMPVIFARQYLDTEDRVLLMELPTLDASRGGAYFFGASNMKWATRLPELPPDERRYIHNFGTGEGSPYCQRQFVQYLVEHKNLLAAKPEQTLIVYGTGFLNAKPAINTDQAVFSNMWQRYGLYEYGFSSGIQPAPLGPLPAQYYLEKARCSSFVKACMDRFSRCLVPKALRRRQTASDPESLSRMYQRRMGPDWQQNMAIHRQELESFADYVRGHGMQFSIVLLPLATWHRPLPYPPKYRELVVEVCKARSIPLVDLSDLLDDDGFSDHIHANERGLDRLAPALMQIARGHLHHIGALPER